VPPRRQRGLVHRAIASSDAREVHAGTWIVMITNPARKRLVPGGPVLAELQTEDSELDAVMNHEDREKHERRRKTRG
jgi:hypothetical protein